MTARSSIRHRLNESTNIWPGFVDVLATLLIVIIFVLMVFTVSQIYLSDAISGRDKALENLRNQINELSKILIIESKEKKQVLEDLSKTESQLQIEKELTLQLESQVAESQATISTQNINISFLSSQIENLLVELKIVAKALETYEGIEVTSLDTKGLGERINKALAVRIDQLKQLNTELDLSQKETAKQLQIVEQLNENLIAINESLGLDDAGLVEQLEAIRQKNTELALANQQLTLANNNLTAINESLGLDDAGLVEQLEAIRQKNTELALANQQLTLANNNLTAINESLGLDDAGLVEQLEAIRQKNIQIFEQLKTVEELNKRLSYNEEKLQNQIMQYQKLTEELIALNDSLDIKDKTLIDQLGLIKNKNTELALLNENLIKKDSYNF